MRIKSIIVMLTAIATPTSLMASVLPKVIEASGYSITSLLGTLLVGHLVVASCLVVVLIHLETKK